MLFERYDKDKDGVVTFQDFANEILTVSQADVMVLQEAVPHR